MLYAEAMKIIENHERGYMVHFEVIEGSTKRSDYFPDKHNGEGLIKDEEAAWELAERFYKATNHKEIINIYVIDNHYSPVDGMEERGFLNDLIG